MKPSHSIRVIATAIFAPDLFRNSSRYIHQRAMAEQRGRLILPSRMVIVLAAVVGFTLLLGAGLGPRAAWAQNELFVANSNNSITVYSRTANGNVAPLRRLFGAATGLNGPQGLAVDAVNNELFVTNAGGGGGAAYITVYASTANGNVAPLRTISGAATGLICSQDLALDTVNNELLMSNSCNNNYITVHARTANGNVAPLRTLTTTGLHGVIGLAVDNVNDELFVADYGSNPSNGSVTVYPRTANGSVAPLRTLSGPSTGLVNPYDMKVDTVNNELVVVDNSIATVTVYARTANGDVAPLRTLSGASTGLSFPVYLAVDTVNNELFVSNAGASSVTVYARTADGNVAPLRKLSGGSTALSGVQGVAVTTVGSAVTCGDASGDSQVTVADVFYMINNLFAGGPPPVNSFDVNRDGKTTVADIFYMINFLFVSGAAPACP